MRGDTRESPLTERIVGVALIVALGWFGKCTYDGRRRAEGAEAVAIAQRKAALDSLAIERRRVDTQYVRDTVRLWRSIESVRTLLDTLMLSDTVVLTKRESVLVFAADTAVKRCQAAVLTCERRVFLADSTTAVLTIDRDYWRERARPSLLTQLSTAAKWLAIGYGVRAVTTR